MGGAYTSTPIVPTTPDVPDGWNPDWPFGDDGEGGRYPYPPGYSPVFSLNLSATETIVYDGAATATITLRDHVTYATAEPTGSSITWTATIDGETVNLRFSGGASYASSVSSSYTEGATYWGAEPVIEFELIEENAGDTVMLRAASIVFDYSVAQTVNIEVANVILSGYAYTYGPTAANGATIELYIDMELYDTTETDESGAWQFELNLVDIDGAFLLILATLGSYEDQYLFPDSITEGGVYGQDDIVFPPIYTARVDIEVTCSENPAVLDTAIGMVYDDWANSKEVGFTWVEGGWSTDTSGSAYFQMTEDTENTGHVDIDADDWNSLQGETLTLYAYARGDDGQSSTIEGSLLLYRDGALIGTYNGSEVATIPVDDPDHVYATHSDWLLINESSVTEL